MFRKEISDFIRSLCLQKGIEAFPETFNGFFLDLYIPGLNRALLFHSLTETDSHSNYDLHELTVSERRISIVHVWEDQWVYQRKKIESRILSLLGLTKRIHGRETSIENLNNGELLHFLQENHMHVPLKAKYKYALKKEREIVAVMSFSKGRPMVRNGETFLSYELLRFCNKLNVTVIGGFSKLLNHFIKLHDPDDIMTYADADWSDGQSFLNYGFDYVETTTVMEFWLNTKTGEREYPHLVLKKHQISSDWTDQEKLDFLQKYAYKTVYNSGSYKFILLRK